MLIGFFGPPCSGKTTLAHALFASLKVNGINGEFVSEYARKHIVNHPKGLDNTGLNDKDQFHILSRQTDEEGLFIIKNNLVVTDTCTANTCFYSDEFYCMDKIEEEIKRYDILFVTSLLEDRIGSVDKNRIHNLDQCRELNVKMFDALNSLNLKTSADRIFHLMGSTEDKVAAALSFVKDRINVKRSA